MQISILGQTYEAVYREKSDDSYLDSCDGYCDMSVHLLVARKYNDVDKREDGAMQNLDAYARKCMRHEIVHAFLYESGLSVNGNATDAWPANEEMTDWIAIQGPKLYAAWEQAGCL